MSLLQNTSASPESCLQEIFLALFGLRLVVYFIVVQNAGVRHAILLCNHRRQR